MRAVFAVAVLASVTASAVTLTGHRLDEYLQAARLSVAPDRVDLEMDLTAGASMANDVFASMDQDGDGTISSDESREYASGVLRATTLELDGRPVRITLTRNRAPELAAMRQGFGVFQLAATAPISRLTPGAHRLFFRNMHQPDISVYLVNALIPTVSSIGILGQHRDVQQHELTLDIRASPTGANWTAVGPIAVMSAVMVVPAALMWRRGQRSVRRR